MPKPTDEQIQALSAYGAKIGESTKDSKPVSIVYKDGASLELNLVSADLRLLLEAVARSAYAKGRFEQKLAHKEQLKDLFDIDVRDSVREHHDPMQWIAVFEKGEKREFIFLNGKSQAEFEATLGSQLAWQRKVKNPRINISPNLIMWVDNFYLKQKDGTETLAINQVVRYIRLHEYIQSMKARRYYF